MAYISGTVWVGGEIVAKGLVIEASLFKVCASTDDNKEGTSAFLEKRAPKFQGK